MNLYKISQKVNNRYDTYDSAIVAARSSKDAKEIYPGKTAVYPKNGKWVTKYSGGLNEGKEYEYDAGDWCNPKDVEVEFIGEAVTGTERGVILASFNAG